MPFKLSALNSITDGISGSLHSTVGAGTSSSDPSVMHDGLPGQLVSATLDGSLTPMVTVAALLAFGGLHLLRTRPPVALRTLSI
jgi:hypothetical protein